MNEPVLNATATLLETDYNFPCVSIIMSFEPKMQPKNQLAAALRSAVNRVDKKVFENFSTEMAMLVLHKLNTVIRQLNYSTHQKSIAIYVSPVFEKVLHLNFEVTETISVNKSFSIRNLIKNKKHLHQYLLLQLTENECRLYVNEKGKFGKVFSIRQEDCLNHILPLEMHERNNRCNEECELSNMGKFFRRIDDTIDLISNSYHLPLFIMGKEPLLTHFNIITKHSNLIIENIESNYEESNADGIKMIIEPYTSCWQNVQQKFLSNQLQAAATQNNFACGIADVYDAAMQHQGSTLLVDEDYRYPSAENTGEHIIYKATKHPYIRFSYVNDMVDEVIEKVLDAGGDVEFVNAKVIEDYKHIALII